MFALSTNNNNNQNPIVMNKFTSPLFAAAFALFSFAPALAAPHSTEADTQVSITFNDDVRTTYSLSVLAVHADGNRAYMGGDYTSLSQAHMAYQAFSFELPEDATVIYATITDSNGNVIFSLND